MEENNLMKLFSSKTAYILYLNSVLQVQNRYNDLICERNQNMFFFKLVNRVDQWLNERILPQFEELLNTSPNNNPSYEILSNFALKKISTYFSNIENPGDLQILRSSFLKLLKYSKYPSFLLTPSNVKSASLRNCINKLSYVLIHNFFDDEYIHFNFIPYGYAHNFIELANNWCNYKTIFHMLVSTEMEISPKADEAKIFLSNLPPEVCQEYGKFREYLELSGNLFSQTQNLLKEGIAYVHQLDEVLNDIKTSSFVFTKIYEDYLRLIFYIYPLCHFLDIVDQENIKIFEKPPTVNINDPNLCSILFSQNEKLKGILDLKIKQERHLKQKYQFPQDTNVINNIIMILNGFNNVISCTNEAIENIDMLDEVKSINNSFFTFFEDKERYDLLVAKKASLMQLENIIGCYKRKIESKQVKLNAYRKEKKKIDEYILMIKNNYNIIEEQKGCVVDCQFCRFERKYVLTSCGHTFCDSCYQSICVLPPINHVCPFCQMSFTFDDIMKIKWNNKEINEDLDDSNDDEYTEE